MEHLTSMLRNGGTAGRSLSPCGLCTEGCGVPGFLGQMATKGQIDPFLSPCTKLNCKWIKDLQIIPDSLKLKEKKLGKTLEDMGTGEMFLNN